ncbi:MAG: type II/IV secretion system protein [Pseudomonadales bacterium]|nr:type II/IV secretion system protein [Candidatus Woesebacteria bacterium]MCB9801502.1 type II/IV secretion system protein [Pseudomonadales bacterium]
MSLTDTQLQKVLQDSGHLSDASLKQVRSLSQQHSISFRKALIQGSVITDEELGKMEAKLMKVPFVVLTQQEIDPDVLNLIPVDSAKKHKTIVFDRDKEGLKVAIADTKDVQLLKLLAKKTKEKVKGYYATEQDIENTIVLYRQDIQKKFAELVKEGLGAVFVSNKMDPPIEKIVDLLIQSSYEQKASDVHIEPKEEMTVVRFRIDGLLYDALRVPAQLHDRIITRIKVLAGLRTDEHMSAQDGKIRTSVNGEDLDLRVSILPVADGEKVVFRLLSSKARSYSVLELGLSERDLKVLQAAYAKPNGMVLSTGPTGSGKTTSIYSILKEITTKEKNITTVEDPIEYYMEGANQVQVNTKANLTFANGLRSILRQDPDYIFVGEIRDNETAGIAVNAALTGHLVVSTLHTNDAASAFHRLIDMDVEPFLVASTVNVIVAQRLVRKICNACRTSSTVTEKELLKNLSTDMIQKHYVPVGDKKEVRVYEGKGCERCHFSGYEGRIGLFEVLEVTKRVKDLVIAQAVSDEIMKVAIEEGMTSMLDDGLDKITKGLTTIEEVLRVTKIEAE